MYSLNSVIYDRAEKLNLQDVTLLLHELIFIIYGTRHRLMECCLLCEGLPVKDDAQSHNHCLI